NMALGRTPANYLIKSTFISTNKLNFLPTCSHIQHMNYAKPLLAGMKKGAKKGGKLGPAAEKVILPVETDPVKLVTYCCGSDSTLENPQDIKLGEDSEYPDWLWTLRTGKAPPLEEMDPETKQYWIKLRRMKMWENNKLASLKKF
ncbi:unnamed protein product, partial [Meganyctiphanes norvegica]